MSVSLVGELLRWLFQCLAPMDLAYVECTTVPFGLASARSHLVRLAALVPAACSWSDEVARLHVPDVLEVFVVLDLGACLRVVRYAGSSRTG